MPKAPRAVLARGAALARCAALCLCGLTLLNDAVAAEPDAGAGPFKVGVAYRSFVIDKPYDWRGAGTHALSVVIWYPAASAAVEEAQWIGAPDRPLFAAGHAARDAALLTSHGPLPLVLLSHGTGGSALQMAWLGTALAAHGYLAVAVNHPGNNASEGYTTRGFATWWERARDLSTVIDHMLADTTFGSHLDARRIAAAGFSLGGYTMIAIAGGVTDPDAYRAFCKSPQADGICRSPPEFPTLVEDFGKLSATDRDFQASLRRAGDSFRDPRVRAVFAMAPALGPAFPAAGLRQISIPVAIVAGTEDRSVPIGSSARYFAATIPRATLTTFAGAGHYVFLDRCTAQGREQLSLLCTDGPGVDREAIHATTTGLTLDFFHSALR